MSNIKIYFARSAEKVSLFSEEENGHLENAVKLSFHLREDKIILLKFFKWKFKYSFYRAL